MTKRRTSNNQVFLLELAERRSLELRTSLLEESRNHLFLEVCRRIFFLEVEIYFRTFSWEVEIWRTFEEDLLEDLYPLEISLFFSSPLCQVLRNLLLEVLCNRHRKEEVHHRTLRDEEDLHRGNLLFLLRILHSLHDEEVVVLCYRILLRILHRSLLLVGSEVEVCDRHEELHGTLLELAREGGR